MKKLLVVMGLCVSAALAFAHTGPETLKIDAAAKKQPAVPFPHGKHSKTMKCDTCHHTNKGLTAEKATAETKIAKCSACHLDPKGDVPSMREMSMTKNPFHLRCISCHKEQKKGPTGVCTGCHKK
ncbi:MAG TPA: cytochrome c3 family protein [Thermoanaerobaculia bacterium]